MKSDKSEEEKKAFLLKKGLIVGVPAPALVVASSRVEEQQRKPKPQKPMQNKREHVLLPEDPTRQQPERACKRSAILLAEPSLDGRASAVSESAKWGDPVLPVFAAISRLSGSQDSSASPLDPAAKY
jgi:hypothetical protein